MSKYLDPKAHITFWKIFGEHPDLLMSLLNALLPLEPGHEIVEVEHLPTEQSPHTPVSMYCSVIVRCKGKDGRQFIVEIHIEFNSEFTRRVLHNASKTYVKQIDKGFIYDTLQPVYSLNLVNDIYEKDDPGFYHHYQMAEEDRPERIIKGLHLLFFELPKFNPQTISEKKMQVLWLRFLTEINEKTRKAPKELLENAELNKALEFVEESEYSDGALEAYDRFWDSVSWENTIENRIKKKHQKAYAEGYAEGRAEAEEIRDIARKMKSLGIDVETIAKATGLTPEEIITAV